MSRILFAIFLQLFVMATSAASAMEPATANPRILIFGDSLSAGYGIATERAWPALLSKRLRDNGYRHEVINLSISGETSSGGLSRLGPALARHRPTIIVLELGANDGLRGLPLDQLRHNLATMIRQSQAAGARVLLVGMRLPPNYGPDYEAPFARIYAELARQYKAALLPLLFAGFAERHEAFQADGLHPTAATQPLLLDNVWGALHPLLGQPVSKR